MARLAVGEKMLDFTAAGAFGPEEDQQPLHIFLSALPSVP